MAERVRQGRHRLGLPSVALLIAVIGVIGMKPSEPAESTAPTTAAYVPIGPVRLADTRETPCGCRRVSTDTITIDVAAHPAVPDEAIAVAITVTATASAAPGYVTAYPGGTQRPLAATLNTRTDRNVSNSAIVPIGADGTLALYQRAAGELVVDLSGAFVPATSASSGRYVPVSSRRLIDTRTGPSPARPLGNGGELTIALPDGVASDATAIVVNVASVGVVQRGHLAARPAGSAPGTTAFMTVDGSGQVVSNATIVPVSADGFTIRSKSGGHVVVDMVGWFTGGSAPSSTTGLFVPAGPRRLHDTREHPPRIWPGGTIEVAVPFAEAAAVVTNVAVTRADRRGHVTAHPARTPKPGTATVNPSFHDHTVANLALTQVGSHGVAYSSKAGVDLIVDATGYFTGEPAAPTAGPPQNTPPRSRVLIVGDSTLAGLDVYLDARSALLGFDAIVDGASCRRLLRPSCLSNVTGLVPNTAVEAIAGTPGRLDMVVVKAGYNDWFSDFPAEFDAVVQAARAKGAHTIVWMSYNERVERSNARRAYQENNVDLYHLAELPRYADVLLADWYRYSDPRQDWFHDGTHTTRAGTYALADFVSRWVAAVEHRPCPRPWVTGWPTPDPCPIPERIGAVPDPIGLYAGAGAFVDAILDSDMPTTTSRLGAAAPSSGDPAG